MNINYSTNKSEIMAWYWKRWKSELWKTHLKIFLIFFIIFFIGHKDSGSLLMQFSKSIFFGLMLPVVFFVYPLLMHKSQNRKISIDVQGIKTTIGSKFGEVSWDEIEYVNKDEKFIYIQGKNGCAFTVPNRAFKNDDIKNKFYRELEKNIK